MSQRSMQSAVIWKALQIVLKNFDSIVNPALFQEHVSHSLQSSVINRVCFCVSHLIELLQRQCHAILRCNTVEFSFGELHVTIPIPGIRCVKCFPCNVNSISTSSATAVMPSFISLHFFPWMLKTVLSIVVAALATICVSFRLSFLIPLNSPISRITSF